MPIRVQLTEYDKDDMAREGIYSIATRDLGAQYFMIKRQPRDAKFVPGKLLVSKVEIVQSWHEQKMFESKKWNIWHSPTMDRVLAYKTFAFASNRGIYVWKRFRDPNYPIGGAETIRDTPPLIVITEEDTRKYDGGVYYHPTTRWNQDWDGPPQRTTDVKLWQSYAKILWEFITRSPDSQVSTDDDGRTICRRVSPQIPGGAIRQLDTGVL